MEPFIILPAWTTGNIILYGYLALMALAVGPLEYFGQAMMAYSKFRPAQGLHPRLGMFILYFLPLVAVTISALPYLLIHPSFRIVFAAVFIHFAKRCSNPLSA
ncbi:MAG: hypothetical protein IPL71_22645 [Anaerolineales bacterium]|uniref:hypothetical protein n=1 Tax=Candidatus Villigracilis proximus TaxID=3140683 RepID=UPI003136B272|nr:hypothetical protein [Anaerolineales bacterium]